MGRGKYSSTVAYAFIIRCFINKFFYISNGTIRIKISDNSFQMSITDVDNFGKHFHNIDHSPSRSGQKSIIFTFMLLLLSLTIIYVVLLFSVCFFFVYILCTSSNNHF